MCFFHTKHQAAEKTPVTARKSSVRREMYADLKKEYDALFERFKAQLTEYRVKLKTDKDGVAAFACVKRFEKIGGKRGDLDNRFHGSLRE